MRKRERDAMRGIAGKRKVMTSTKKKEAKDEGTDGELIEDRNRYEGEEREKGCDKYIEEIED